MKHDKDYIDIGFLIDISMETEDDSKEQCSEFHSVCHGVGYVTSCHPRAQSYYFASIYRVAKQTYTQIGFRNQISSTFDHSNKILCFVIFTVCYLPRW